MLKNAYFDAFEPAPDHIRAEVEDEEVRVARERGADDPVRATTQHSFGGSFSAGSKPIFASKYAFFSIFQNLQENHLLASKCCKFLLKIVKDYKSLTVF